MPYLSASAVVIHYEEALYQVYVPLPFNDIVVCAATPISGHYGRFSTSINCWARYYNIQYINIRIMKPDAQRSSTGIYITDFAHQKLVSSLLSTDHTH